MKTRCYLVVGPESSGTRLVTSLLMDCGCAGSSGHHQEFDHGAPQAEQYPLAVWRRSVPHGPKMPDLRGMVRILLRQGGYDQVVVVVVARDSFALGRSQKARSHLRRTGPGVQEKLIRAYAHIFDEVLELRLIWSERIVAYMLPYEALVLQGEKAVSVILKALGLPKRKGKVKLRDENAKHYGGE